MVLVGDRIEQGGDAAVLVVEPEIACREDGLLVARAFMQISQDADQVSRALRAGGDQDLVFQQVHQVRGIGPCLQKFLAHLGLVRRGDRLEAEVFANVDVDQCLDCGRVDLNPVLEQAVQQ